MTDPISFQVVSLQHDTLLDAAISISNQTNSSNVCYSFQYVKRQRQQLGDLPLAFFHPNFTPSDREKAQNGTLTLSNDEVHSDNDIPLSPLFSDSESRYGTIRFTCSLASAMKAYQATTKGRKLKYMRAFQRFARELNDVLIVMPADVDVNPEVEASSGWKFNFDLCGGAPEWHIPQGLCFAHGDNWANLSIAFYRPSDEHEFLTIDAEKVTVSAVKRVTPNVPPATWGGSEISILESSKQFVESFLSSCVPKGGPDQKIVFPYSFKAYWDNAWLEARDYLKKTLNQDPGFTWKFSHGPRSRLERVLDESDTGFKIVNFSPGDLVDFTKVYLLTHCVGFI